MTRSVLLLLLCAAPSWAQPARAIAPEAVGHMERGQRLFETQRYEEAAREFRAGYLIDPHPHFLYSIGQAERMRGNCTAALEAYKAFLRTGPNPDEAAVAEVNIERCERTLAAERAQAERRERAVAPAPPPADRPAWYTDVVGHVLVGGGLVGVALGTGYLLSAEEHVDQANAASIEDDWRDHREQVDRDRLIGGVALAAGGALVVAGLIRFVLEVRAGATVAATPRGGVFVLEGSF